MEPPKAGNEEEDEMHPVPAKVLSHLIVSAHTAVASSTLTQCREAACKPFTDVSLRACSTAYPASDCTPVRSSHYAQQGLLPCLAAETQTIDLSRNKVLPILAALSSESCSCFADSGRHITNVPRGQEAWQGWLWPSLPWQASGGPPQLKRHKASSGLQTATKHCFCPASDCLSNVHKLYIPVLVGCSEI